jgi:FkbM family methyltransferase
MEGTARHAPVIGYLTACLPDSPFMLVDIGCSGGIDDVWTSFGARLRALALDSDVTEIERLQRAETRAGVRYLAALASLPGEHPFALKKNGRPMWGRNPWARLSVVRSADLTKKDGQRSPHAMTEAHDRANLTQTDVAVVVPRYLEEHGIGSVDFLKIDVDGADFDVLNSFDGELDRLAVLGVGIEVNYFGTDADTDHTFHNVDRFMKARGFELFDLTVRRYSTISLPGRFVKTTPSPTEFGRPLQGDALYVRDLANAEYDAMAARLPVVKLANLVCLFAACTLPDCAAEVVTRFRDRLSAVCDVDRVLDLLAEQAQWPTATPLSYAEYIRRFESHDRALFFAQPGGTVEELRRRLTEATNRIAAMETSKFWALRRHWFQVKRLAGLGGEE